MSTNGNSQLKPIRCAIYTRKSTSEGLEQEFSSLDAQREAALHYIASQKTEGWVVLSEQYDDGGFTGANLERPALQKLLADIREGRIDCVLVYKVDRLSRSLLDFTHLLELFEQHMVTFVSVTQAFNTNSSMGRLTLNILLSFAQFERELISERTKDKMAAARKKGRWIGGPPILGYNIEPATKRLIINDKEAVLVRQIFELYLTERSLLGVTKYLNSQGQTSKRHVTKKGKVIGGTQFNITRVQAILKNVLYMGKVAYGGQHYPGQHDPIIGEELFAKAQAVMAENCVIRRMATNTKGFGLLARRLICQACQCAMIHTYTAKDTRRYRYYVCTDAQKRGYEGCPTRSVNAQAIEEAVVACIKQLSKDPQRQSEALDAMNSRLKSEAVALAKQEEQLKQKTQSLNTQIKGLTDDINASRGDAQTTQASLKGTKTGLEDAERSLSDVRVQQTKAQEQQVSQQELQEALSVTSPAWETFFPQLKRRVLERLLERVEYDAPAKRLVVTLSAKGVQVLQAEIKGMGTGEVSPDSSTATLRFEFPVELARINHRKLKKQTIKQQALPGIRRSLVLGYQLRKAIEVGQASSPKQLSSWLHLTPARVSQLLSLMLLAPNIQEEILLCEDDRRIRITEQKIRQVASEPVWKKQQVRWQVLTGALEQK